MENYIDFLQPDISSIRKSIKGIDDSYNNFWDILAELLQNSVDAITKKKQTLEQQGNKLEVGEKDEEIHIEIDCTTGTIKVKDTGIGIKKEKIPILLKPFSTDKENSYAEIGEKGVGLKYVIFQSNKFTIKTNYLETNEPSFMIINNAKQWKESSNNEILKLEVQNNEENINGTEITVTGVKNEELFQLDFPSMKYIIRTKTAVGNVLNIFEETNKIKIYLKMIDLYGNKHEEILPYKYLLPIENLNGDKGSLCDLTVFETQFSDSSKSDREKREYLKDKIIYKQDEINYKGYRKIKYWACFVPQRKTWNVLSVRDNLLKEEMIDDEEEIEKRIFSIHRPGIYTSVKGMPTGITIDNPSSGKTGYWPNIFIIFEDATLKFDIGRKSINGNVKIIYQNLAKDIFKEFTKYVAKYVAGDIDLNTNVNWDRDLIRNEIDSMARLENSIVNFRNKPTTQEASVAAIFFELIGANKIEGLEPVISGYKNKYDLYAFWKTHFVVIEFKTHLRNILKDFNDEIKYSNEIDYVICWEVNDEDFSAFSREGYNLTKITRSILNEEENENYIPFSTHVLIIPSAKPIYVIDLKELIDNLQVSG